MQRSVQASLQFSVGGTQEWYTLAEPQKGAIIEINNRAVEDDTDYIAVYQQPNIRFDAKLHGDLAVNFFSVSLISVCGFKEHVRKNISVHVDRRPAKGRLNDILLKGETLESVIEHKIKEGTLPDSLEEFPGFVERVEMLSRVWHLPEDSIIPLIFFRPRLNGIYPLTTPRTIVKGELLLTNKEGLEVAIGTYGPVGEAKRKVMVARRIRLSGQFGLIPAVLGAGVDNSWNVNGSTLFPYNLLTPPLSITARAISGHSARISGELSYEQTLPDGREGIKRRGPESVELSQAKIVVLDKPASVQSQAVAAAHPDKRGLMPITYSGRLYVDPRILELAQQHRQN